MFVIFLVKSQWRGRCTARTALDKFQTTSPRPSGCHERDQVLLSFISTCVLNRTLLFGRWSPIQCVLSWNQYKKKGHFEWSYMRFLNQSSFAHQVLVLSHSSNCCLFISSVLISNENWTMQRCIHIFHTLKSEEFTSLWILTDPFNGKKNQLVLLDQPYGQTH